jgi:hypothetical protein
MSFPSSGAATDWTVSLRGAGPVRLGMTLSEVRRVLGDRAAHLEGNTPEVALDVCAYLESKAIPEHLGFMFARGRVVRVDVSGTGVRTASGAGVGDTEERIKRLYPAQITVEPHHYDPEKGHYLNYWPKDAKREYGMVFETDGEKVTSFRVGTSAAIALVEGCS